MSIDNRVVKLQFDNTQFEAGVSQSMKTIDELEDKLQFKKSAKGFQSLQNASDTVTFEKLAASIESINSKLSATGVLAAKFVNSIADTIVSGVKKVEAASIGQIKTGGWNRAMNIENAKFAVQGLKGDWDELNKAIDYSVSGTAYGFDEAAKAASTFMASGVDYSKTIEKNGNTEVTMMHKALRAISGVAAQTNSSFTDISHIFTTVAGNGRLMADQLNQLSGRGMNAAAILGEQLHMSEAAVREATSKGQISFEVFAKAMDDAFGEHAKDANKTFTGSLSNMKAALSRFGAVFATPIIQKTNTFFVALTQKINEMKKAIADVTENGKVLEEHLESHFAKMWENLIKLGSTLVGTIDLTWFKNVANGVDKFTQKLSTALEIMNAFASDSSSTANSAANAAYDLTKITKGELDMTYKIIRGEFAAGQERKRQLEQYIKENNMSYDPKKLQAYVNVMARVGYILEKSGIKVVDESTEENEKLGRTNNMVTDTYLNMYLAVTNFNKTLSNLRNSIGQYLTAITEPFGGFIGILSIVTHLIKEVGNGFNDLVNAIKPTEGVLLGVYSVGEAIGQILSELIAGVETLVRSVGKFVLSVMDQWKESGILQAVLYDLSETLKNLWHVISNIGVSIGRIFKAIATAFFTVFNPAKATGLVSSFTGSLATLSDQVLLSEDAAEELTECLTLIFGVIEGIVSAIASVATKIFAFIGSFKNADAEVEVFTGTVEETGEVIEETGEQIEGVVEESSKLVKVARKVKDFFVKLFDTLSQNAGVIRLKEAFVTLGNAFKTSVKDGAQSIGDTFKKLGDGKSVKLSVEDVANGIGWLADKIAILVENIPGAITAIENFFSSAYNSVKNFFSNVKSGGNGKDGAGSFGEGVKNDLLSILGFGKDFAISFAKSAKEAIDFIAKALNGITWKDVIEGAFFIGAAAFITKIARLMDSMGMMFRSVSSLIGGIRSLVIPLQKSLIAVARALSMASFSAVILSIAFAFIGIAVAIKMIAEIPESGMYRAVAVVLLIGAILAVLMGIYSLIKKSEAKIQEERTKQLALVGKFEGIVLTIFAVAAIFYALSKVIGELINAVAAMTRAMNEVNDADITASFMMILGIIFFILILSVVMLKSSQQLVKTLQKTTSSSSMLLSKGKVMYGFLAAMGIFMAGIGVGISMIVDAAVKLTESDHDITQAMGLMLAMIAALLFGTAAVLYASKDVKPKALLTVAVLMLELIIGVVILFGAIFVLAAFMSLEQFAGIKDKISEAGTLMAMVLLSLAVSVMLIGLAVRTMTSAGGTTADASAKIVTKIMLGMIVLMAAIVAGIALIAKEMSGLSTDQQQTMIMALTMVSGLLIGLSLMIVVILAIISKMKTKALQNASKILLGMGGAFLMILVGIAAIMYVAGSTGIADNTTAMIVITGSIVLIMAVMAIVFNEIAKSMKSMNTPVLDKIIPTMLTLAGIILVIGIIEAVLMYVAKDATLGDIVTFVIMIAAMGLIAIGAVKLAKEVNKLNSHAGEKLIGLAAAVAAFGVAMFLLSAACKLMNDVDPGSILKLLGLVLGMVAIITLFALVVGKVPAIVTGFNAIKNTLLGIAAAFLIFGVAMIASAAGISMMAPALMEFADAFNYVGTAIEQHSGVAIGIGVLIVVILLVVAYTILKTLPVINRIVTAVVQAVIIIGKVLEALGKGIIKGIDNFANGSQLHRTITAGIAGLIVAAASALTKAGPTVLQRIGDIVIMVIDWLIDAIPTICEKLLQILLKIIFGLCDAIFRNINKISAAISSVVLALGAVLATVIRDVVRMLLYGIFGENAVTKKIVDAVGTACTGAADRFRSMAQDITKDAEEMDKAIAAGGNAVDAWNMNHQDYMSDVAEGARKTGENIRELNEQLANKSFEKYARLHRINFDNAYLYAEKVTGLAEDVMDAEVMAGDAFYAQNDKGIEEFFRIKVGSVSAFQKGNHEYYKIGEKLAKSLNEGVSDNVDVAAATEQSNTEKLSPDLSASFGDKLGNMLGMGDKKDQEKAGEEAGTNVLGGLTDKLSTGFSNIVGGGSGDNPISNLTSGFTDKLGDTGMLGGISFGEGVDSGIMTTLPDLTDTSKFMGEDLSSSLTDGFSIGMVENQDQVEAAGSAVINTTAAEMTSDENQAKMKEAGEMSTASYAWALSLNKGKMMAAGRNIVDGLRIPIEEFADDDTRDPRTVGYFGKRICDILINTIEGHEGLDIGSPSKKMRQIGNFVVQGLTEGIYDEENGAINSMASLSNMVLNSFTNPLDYVRNIANGTYSYDPSIRPVLDTSLISRGAYGINSMFDHQNVTLNGLSGSIAADIGQLDGSNAEIIAELRALRGDMTAMGEQIAGMQVVMDSGRLVGAISADMDRALGSRATANLRGKGN